MLNEIFRLQSIDSGLVNEDILPIKYLTDIENLSIRNKF